MDMVNYLSRLTLVLLLLSCNSQVQQKDTESDLVSRYKEIVSDFSTGSYYLTLKISDTTSNQEAQIVIASELLHRAIGEAYVSEDNYVNHLAGRIANNLSVEVSPEQYITLQAYKIDGADLKRQNGSTDSAMFINTTFQRNNAGVYLRCFNNEQEKKEAIFTLIDRWNIFPRKDDETGCVVLLWSTE